MFINKIEEARYFFDFTNIYIVDPILMKFCVSEAHTRCKYSDQKLKYTNSSEYAFFTQTANFNHSHKKWKESGNSGRPNINLDVMLKLTKQP